MPPRYGKLAISERATSASVINGYRTEPWVLPGARILELRSEIDDELADALLPPALHPAMPAYAIFAVTEFPESPVGPFKMGEVRVVGRAGGRPVAFVLAGFCDNITAAIQLSARWGYPLTPAEIRLVARHFDFAGLVSANGRRLLELELSDRRPLPSVHLQPVPSMNLAHNQEDGKLVLIQVDIEAAFAHSDGGSQRSVMLDPEAFRGADNLRLLNPMSATFALADITIGRIQLICNPEIPAESGTTFLD